MGGAMYQLFFRSRARNLIQHRLGGSRFRVRSPDRDAETDRARVALIMTAIETALQGAEGEQVGLTQRVEDALARAAVTMGNDSDEYLDREPHNDRHQDLFNREIESGQRRLKELATVITHFRFMKAAMLSRFPDLKPEESKSWQRES